jgi:hypothetical protein
VNPLSTTDGHITQITGRGGFDSPTNKYPGKTACFNSRRYFNAVNIQERQTKNVCGDSGQIVSGRPSSLGKAKGRRQNGADDRGRKKRRNHRCWTKEAFPIDESSVGSEEKSKRKEVNSAQQVFSQRLAAAIG